jgi:hypothetical protein
MRATSKTKRNLTVFSAAMATIHVAPTLHADIVGLTASPASLGAVSVGVPITLSTTSNAATVAQFNMSHVLSINNINTIGPFLFFVQSFTSLTLSPSQFSLVGTPAISNTLIPGSIAHIAFSDGLTAGWFTLTANIDFTLTITGGLYGTEGESIHIGPSAVPEPSTATGLALLALGAAGVRRRKKDCQSQSAA